MNENIKIFLEKVEADPQLQSKLAEVRDPDEAYAIASSIQGGFTKEEFIAEMTRIKEASEENLTDADLAKSAGGIDATDVVTSIAISIVVSTDVSVVTTGVAIAAAL